MSEHRNHRFEPRPQRILLVDDTPDNLFLMNCLLENRFDVVQAQSGPAALKEVMSDNPPDMVVLDIMMPDMDGYEVLRRIRQHPPTADIPVVFLTALASPQDEKLGLELGAVDYLTKPVDPEKVVERIEANARVMELARRMNALSERLSSRLTPSAWRQLFHGPQRERIRFEERALTLLFVEYPHLTKGWSTTERSRFIAEVDRLAERHLGTADHFAWGGTAIFFDDPAESVRMATDLQRRGADLRLRMGITSGVCEVATFELAGKTRNTVIGVHTDQAAQVAATAASGSIVISPEAYELMQEEVHADTHGCLLAEEFNDSDLASASLTPTPVPGAADLSTFAGLGSLRG